MSEDEEPQDEAEPALTPIPGMEPKPILPHGVWEVSVHRRRSHAGSDDDQAEAPAAACAVCGSQATRCLWNAEMLGTCFTLATREYLCQACGKYTVYEYED